MLCLMNSNRMRPPIASVGLKYTAQDAIKTARIKSLPPYMAQSEGVES